MFEEKMKEKERFDQYLRSVHAALKTKIRAHIFVTTHENDLIIKISNKGVSFGAFFSDISQKVTLGFPAERIANEVIKEYKKYIENTFFYEIPREKVS